MGKKKQGAGKMTDEELEKEAEEYATEKQIKIQPLMKKDRKKLINFVGSEK